MFNKRAYKRQLRIQKKAIRRSKPAVGSLLYKPV